MVIGGWTIAATVSIHVFVLGLADPFALFLLLLLTFLVLLGPDGAVCVAG